MIAIARSAFVRLGRRIAEIAIARIRAGNARNMSVRRINASSHRPPIHPAAVPANVPNALAAVTTPAPERTEIRVPYITRL